MGIIEIADGQAGTILEDYGLTGGTAQVGSWPAMLNVISYNVRILPLTFYIDYPTSETDITSKTIWQQVTWNPYDAFASAKRELETLDEGEEGELIGRREALYIDYPTSETDITSKMTWQQVVRDLYEAFALAKRELETLDEGEEGEFPGQLSAIVTKHQSQAIDIISTAIEEEWFDHTILSDVLSLIGEFENVYNHDARLELLTTNLFSSSHEIRYGAMAGLAVLNDPTSIPELKHALESETESVLQRVLKQIIEYLEQA